ncbi:MAG TPA: LamG-like jellyroll fold domain-containing protein [Kofleriaceae bacterium]|nr:LamG-like jellyroll fold domain-containing protein [Kofleriaceae bacterium]
MRKILIALLATAACSIPDKQPLGDDNGSGEEGTGELQTEITDAPSDFSSSSVATFTFKANVPSATFQCTLDNGAPEPCTSPFSRSLPDGSHMFSVRATDTSGNTDDSPAEHLWSIDTVAPSTMITEAPAVADNSTMVTFRFTSGEMNVSFECSIDNGAFAPCRSGDQFGPISDGAHAFAVRAKDRAGNVDSSPAIHAWSVDTSTPDTTLIDGPVGASNSTSATFTFVSPDAGTGATFECSLDGGAFATCVSPHGYSNLSMGQHTFQVRVRDAVGNYDPSPATRTWIIDATPPETMITAAPSGSISMTSAAISFTANENDVTFECSLDGTAMANCTSPYNAMNLGQGAHTFSVRATDAAGNTDSSAATATWTVDTVAPNIMITGGPGNGDTVGPRVVYTFSASEGTVTCSVGGAAARPCTSPFGFNSAAGNQSFTINATDAAGNMTTISRSFTITCSAPDPAGSLGLLHLDDNGQTLANATGGASATLGNTDQAEAIDPMFTSGRFSGGLAFDANQGDLVAWPLAAGSTSNFTIELWASPASLSGTRDILLSGDGRIAVRVTGAGGNVTFSAAVIDNASATHTVTSAPVAAGAWHHVIASLSDATLRLWVDGVRTEIGDARPGTAPALDSVRLGGAYGGSLDEVFLSATPIGDDESARGRFCPASGVVY